MEQATGGGGSPSHHQRRNQRQQRQAASRQQHPPPPHLECPRCDSSNTKFCYYNNYSLSQPRYFCKACRRYWTHGGTLRNVPIGGGCRRNKRPSKTPSSTSLSRTDQMARTKNPTAVISGQPPVMPSMGSSFYGDGGGFMPPFAAMQSLSAGGGNQGATVNLGGGGGQFGANMTLLQAMAIQSLKSPVAANQFQPLGNLFPAQQRSINPPIRPWTQNLNTAGGAGSSAVGSSFWNCTTIGEGGGGDQVGPSFSAANQWSNESHPGFNPSHQ
ncbi:hypothetical protein OROMI_023679 [Orobanche minor]